MGLYRLVADGAQLVIEATLELADYKGAPVAWIGDQAFLQNEVDVGQYHLLAERQGDVGIKVIGENSDAVVAIAKLLLTRLQ